jgi:hypothetical protein
LAKSCDCGCSGYPLKLEYKEREKKRTRGEEIKKGKKKRGERIERRGERIERRG